MSQNLGHFLDAVVATGDAPEHRGADPNPDNVRLGTTIAPTASPRVDAASTHQASPARDEVRPPRLPPSNPQD